MATTINLVLLFGYRNLLSAKHMLYILITTVFLSGFSSHPKLPADLQQCIEQYPAIRVDWSQQPVFLKVFFTHSKEPTYVLAIDEGKQRSRALVCQPGGKATILGSTRSAEPFSTLPDDNYMSSRWRVCSKKQVAALRKYYSDVPTPANESVCLLWEDGEAVIYSDGLDLRWKSLLP